VKNILNIQWSIRRKIRENVNHAEEVLATRDHKGDLKKRENVRKKSGFLSPS